MKKRSVLVLVLLAALAGALYTGFGVWGTPARTPRGWAGGDFSAAARSYYDHAMKRTIKAWQQDARTAEREIPTGRLREPHRTYLVIDMNRLAMWMEKDGRALPETRIDLPERLAWTLNHTTPEGTRELAGLVRLKIRGRQTGQLYPEMLELMGYAKEAGHIHINFGAASWGGGSGMGQIFVKTPVRVREEGSDCYESILVTDSEYAAEQRLRDEAAGEDRPGDPREIDPSGFRANLAAWRKVEKRIYKEIEQQVLAAGYVFESMDILEWPDYQAADAKVTARRRGRSRIFDLGPSFSQTLLSVEHLGQGVWYAKSGAPSRDLGIPSLDMEFLVCSGEDLSEEERRAWLEKGRERQ